MTAAYDELQRTWTRLHHFGHLQSIAGWDRAAMMPPKGNDARAAAMAEMDGLTHQMRTDSRLADLLKRAEDENLDESKRANLREIRRQWRASNALPQALVEASSLASARCEHAWRTQRPATTGPASWRTSARCSSSAVRARSASPTTPASACTTR